MTARCNVLGVGVSAVNMDSALAEIESAVREKRRGYICVTGVHGVMECQEDEALRRIHNASFLTVPDGMPLVWVGRATGFRQMGRVYGPDMMLEVMKRSAVAGWTHFLYGGGDGIADRLKSRLEVQFPGIRVAGTYTPPFRPLSAEEEKDFAARVSAAKPDFLWVGLSTPKQERFMAAMAGRLDATLMVGVGAAFDLHAGLKPDAPEWIKRSGLQWFHRLCQEPRRLFRRYAWIVPGFLGRIALQLAGLRKYRLEDGSNELNARP